MVRKKLKINIPDDIKIINNVFKRHNIKLYIVGGAVRDLILDEKIKDWDLVSEAVPSKIIEMFSKEIFVKNILLVGESFGVISLVTENDTFEIATMRSDVYDEFSNNRHPNSVIFGNIIDDANRRDLTFNALYFDIDTSEIVDLVGGLKDLNKGIVRTVGRAEDRFNEDKLRILRTCRFASRFNSELDSDIESALIKDASLEGISAERIRDEFLKGIKSAKYITNFFELLDKFNLFNWIFKGLSVNKNFIKTIDPIVAIAILLKGNDVDLLKKQLNKLTYSTDEIKAITFLLSLPNMKKDSGLIQLKKQQKNSGLTKWQIMKVGQDLGISNRFLNCFLRFNLSVTGEFVMKEHGIPAGPELGKMIEEIEMENFKTMLNSCVF